MPLPVAVVGILASLGTWLVQLGGQFVSWAKQELLRLARAARALAVWALAHAALRTALLTASVVAFEAFTVYLTGHVITPLTSSFIRRCLPAGTDADGILWLLWDTGLNGRAIFNSFVVYMANYSALWLVMDRWVRAQSIALSTYRAALRRAEAIRQSSV